MGRASRRKKTVQGSSADEQPSQSPAISFSPLEQADWLLIGFVALAALVLYARTLCRTIFTSGTGENVTAVAMLGVPHPPGFPLFVLLAKLFTFAIPFGNVAFRVNFFAAMCGAAAAAMLYVLCRSLAGPERRFAAVATALMFAFSQTFWSQAVIAEVYTLNALLLVTIFYLIVRWEAGGKFWPVALFAGLGLTVHPLQLLFFPGWLYFILKSPRRRTIGFEDMKLSLAAFAGALCLHVYPFLRSKANPPLDWGNPETGKNLYSYLTASQYRDRMFSLSFTEVVENARQGVLLLFTEFTPWLFLIPVGGAFFLFKQNRRLFVATLMSAVLTFFYAINYNIPWEIDVYYIPVVLIAAFWSFWLFSIVPFRFGFFLPLVAVLPLLLNFHHNDRSKNSIALDYGIDLLTTVPENGTLILPQTDAAFSVLYLTAVEHKRPDLKVWVHNDKGFTTLRDGVNPDAPSVPMEKLLADNKEVYLAQRVTAETARGYQTVPYGTVYLLVPGGNKPGRPPIDFRSYRLEKHVVQPPKFFIDDRNRAVLAAYHMARGDAVLSSGQNSPAMQEYLKAESLGKDLAEIRSQLALRFAELGNKTAAIAQLRASLNLTESAGDHNRLGRLLAETGRTDEAMTAFVRAIQLEPNLAIAHSNLGAILGMKGDTRRAIEELELSVKLDPTDPKAHNNIALVYIKTGNRAEAAAHLKASLNLDPNQELVKKQLDDLNVEYQ